MSGSTATIRGDREVIRILRDLRGRVKDMQPVWTDVADLVSRTFRRQFDTEGIHLTGTSWQPLNPQYLQWKIANRFDPRRLRKTGDLFDSLAKRPMAIERYSRFSATFGTDIPYAQFHQFGRGVPQRKIVEVTPEFAKDVNDVLKQYLLSRLVTV